MISEARVPSEGLLTARRSVDGVEEITLLEDWQWNETVGRWVLHCRLSPSIDLEGPIPATTDWYVLVEPSYPWGVIKFCPAKIQGVKQTFHHQSYNSPGPEELPWRAGDICLDTTVRALGRGSYDLEPYEIQKRLRWRFNRALTWLEAASRDELSLPGEPFELPQFPGIVERPPVLAFSEGADSFMEWQHVDDRVGFVDVAKTSAGSAYVKSFSSADKQRLITVSWGNKLRHLSNGLPPGIWLRLHRVPVLQPWQAPANWGELREACELQDIKIDDLIKVVASNLRDGKRHLALVGFPIPARVGDDLSRMHWQALLLPTLSEGKKTAKGFRPDEQGYWRRDRQKVLLDNQPLQWVTSENWHVEQISTRGRLPQSAIPKKLLLLGAGALGSIIAELLLRAGVHRITIMDGDRSEAGNLVRHTLGLDAVGKYKASAVAERLNLASPHARVDAVNTSFPPVRESDKILINQSEVVLDCTGTDDVLQHLAEFPWDGKKFFISLSLGINGQRLFCFATHHVPFPHNTFREMINPWLQEEVEQYTGQDLPREGIGCWHSVFPARVDDVSLMASIAVKHIEALIRERPSRPHLVVFEQCFENGVFSRVEKRSEEIADA